MSVASALFISQRALSYVETVRRHGGKGGKREKVGAVQGSESKERDRQREKE